MPRDKEQHEERIPLVGSFSAGGAALTASLAEQQLFTSARSEAKARQDRTNLPDRATAAVDEASDTLTADSDEAIFQLFQRGDERQFIVLYERYRSKVYSYCAKTLISAGLDDHLVEDAFQETFMRVAQYQHTFTGGEFRPWIFTIARHTCLSLKKKGLRHKISMEHVGDGENLDEGSTQEVRMALSRTDDALERMTKQEQIDLLLKAIEMLPETYREALILSDYEGMTYDEIGKLTGTSLSTIRIRIFRAKARLRKMLLPIIGDEVDRIIQSEDEHDD